MRPLITKLTPSRGFSHAFYFVYNAFLPLLVFLLVRTNFSQLALSLILLSKWRMFAVRPRFWLANIRANAVDMVIGVAVLAFMVSTGNEVAQLLWSVLWASWLIVIKPRADTLWVSLQALISFVAGLMALFLTWDHAPLGVLSLQSVHCAFLQHTTFLIVLTSRTPGYSHFFGLTSERH
jgi:hypothetical protein